MKGKEVAFTYLNVQKPFYPQTTIISKNNCIFNANFFEKLKIK